MDEELRAVGVDSEVDRVRARLLEQVDELREESVFGNAAPENSYILNEGADGDQTLDEIFPCDEE